MLMLHVNQNVPSEVISTENYSIVVYDFSFNLQLDLLRSLWSKPKSILKFVFVTFLF